MDSVQNEPYILEMQNITKSFYGVKALDDVTFQVKKGEIHGLVGENGAGKSTIMKILAGLYSNDSGRILFEGQDITSHLSTKAVEELGISFIHQERYVVPHLTVAEMLFLGKEITTPGLPFLKRREMEALAEKTLKERMGVELPGSRRISSLTVGEQQLVQICRALLNDPKIIVFDEPTAVLAKKEADRLFQIIHQLKKDRGVIYISHYFGEILDLCDMVTVLRNGKKITTVPTAGMTIEHLVTLMVGRDVRQQYPPRTRTIGETVLKVEHLTHQKQFQDVSFELHKGEILGITGLMGSGHDQVGISLFDSQGITGGTITYKGKQHRRMLPHKAAALKIGYVPDDRRGLGALQIMTVKENVSLASLYKVSRRGVIKKKNEADLVNSMVEKLNVKTAGIDIQCGFLSGGNQQKVVLAKWLSSDAEVYILNQPTSGVDIGARAEIYSIIDNAAKAGAAILLITQDTQELYGMSDRVITMYRGKISMQCNIDECTDKQIIVAMMGGEKDA